MRTAALRKIPNSNTSPLCVPLRPLRLCVHPCHPLFVRPIHVIRRPLCVQTPPNLGLHTAILGPSTLNDLSSIALVRDGGSTLNILHRPALFLATPPPPLYRRCHRLNRLKTNDFWPFFPCFIEAVWSLLKAPKRRSKII